MYIKFNLLFLLLVISMNTFSNISNNPSDWYVVTDRVMGGSSNLKADFNEGIFRMTGNVVKKDGGFVRLVHNPHCLLYTSPSPRDPT